MKQVKWHQVANDFIVSLFVRLEIHFLRCMTIKNVPWMGKANCTVSDD